MIWGVRLTFICSLLMSLGTSAAIIGEPWTDDVIFRTPSASYRFRPEELGDKFMPIENDMYEQVVLYTDWQTGLGRGGHVRDFYQHSDDIRDDEVMIVLSAQKPNRTLGPGDSIFHTLFPKEMRATLPEFRLFTDFHANERVFVTQVPEGWFYFSCSDVADLEICRSSPWWDGTKTYEFVMQEKLLPRWYEVLQNLAAWVERHAIR